MASTDATAIPIKNQAYRITFPILDADGDPVSGATALDSEISKDGGTFADCTNEATEIATSSGMYFLDLTATEMNADTVAVMVKTSTAGAKTTMLVLYPAEDTDIRANVRSWLGSAPNALISGRVDASAGALGVGVITDAAVAASGATKIRSIVFGTTDSGGTTTMMVDSGRTESATDHWKGDFILFNDGALAGQCRLITGFNPTTDTITFAPAITQSAAAGFNYEILPAARVDLHLWLGSVVNSLVSGRIDASVGAVATNAIDDAAVATDMDSYHAKVWMNKNGTTADNYGVQWFKNGVPLMSGVTSPTIRVYDNSGVDLIATTAMSQVGSEGQFKYVESTNKTSAGVFYWALVSATIDGATRAWPQQVPRDLAA